MNAAMKQILDSPDAPQRVQELVTVLEDERRRREEFIDQLKEDEKAEFINGEVIVHSPVRSIHAEVTANIHALLDAFVHKHALGRVTYERVLVEFPRNAYEPDVCVFLSEKAATIQRDQMVFPIPDLAVEVLSPSTESVDRGVKFDDYQQNGVKEYWIVDPDNETVEVYELVGSEYNMRSQGTDVESRLVQGFKVGVKAIFNTDERWKAIDSIRRGT